MDLSAEDPRISDLLDGLEAEIPLVAIADRAFADEAVYLDGRSFTRCTFTHCVLVSRLGSFRMTSCKVAKPQGVVVSGPSLRLFELMHENEVEGGELITGIGGGRSTIGHA